MSDYYYNNDSENKEEANNNYNYYSHPSEETKRTYSPYDGPEAEKKANKKKGGFKVKVAKVVCLGLVFGLTSGGVFWGINHASSGNSGAGTSGNGTSSTSVNIVKTSSTDVKTIKATDVSDIVEQAMPSIVAVSTEIEKTTDFFGQTYSQKGSGAGSGFMISQADGQLYVLTNYHVIQNSTSISVTFNDGTTADATVKGYDENADIAVLNIDYNALSEDTKSKIAVAVMGDSDQLKAGNGAIAIGNALGYGQSVTTGSISAVDREVQMTDGSVTLIQTDAAINPGNSGGALLNTKGEVIGVNTVKYSDTSVEGMGFAIPINSALKTAQGIIDGSIVPKTDENTAYLGISGGTLDQASAEKYGYPTGVYVSSVAKFSAAERAGLRQGDVIVSFNGEDALTMEDLQQKIQDCQPGDEVSLTVKRQDGQGSFSDYDLTTILGSKADAVTK